MAFRLLREATLPTSLGPMLGEVEVVRLYIDRRDWWVGYYRGERHHYVCLVPTVVLRWHRRAA